MSLNSDNGMHSTLRDNPVHDPTINDQIYLDIWDRLRKKIQTDMASNASLDSRPEEFLKEDESNHFMSKRRKFGQSIRRLLKLVSKAFLNPIHIPWDVDNYYHKHVKGGDNLTRIEFPNPVFGSFSKPLTVVDTKGRIVLWYLPGLLSKEQQSEISSATIHIAPLLKKSILSNTWRNDEAIFLTKTSKNILEPGAVNFSSGWLGLGHETEKYDLLPSYNLRVQPHLGSPLWLRNSNEVERFINLTLSLINPDLFQSGLEMLRKLRQMEKTKDIALEWQSVYNGISVISNRITPAHRDGRGRREWFDTLVNYCDEEARPRLLINDLGLDLEYGSGTVVALSGSIFMHEVKAWGDSDRLCYAHFMREATRKRLDASAASWVHQQIYLP